MQDFTLKTFKTSVSAELLFVYITVKTEN